MHPEQRIRNKLISDPGNKAKEFFQPDTQELQDKHYYRKHGANAYYGQIKK